MKLATKPSASASKKTMVDSLESKTWKNLLYQLKNKKSPISADELVDLKKCHAHAASIYYEKGKGPITDAEFDYIEEVIKKADPKWKPPIGAPVTNKKVERKLSVPCPSLGKIKHEKPEVLQRFLNTLPPGGMIRVEAKIDGATLLGDYDSGRLVYLTTRGDGINGQSIDGFIKPSLRVKGRRTGLVSDLTQGSNPYPKTFALRFEVAMRKDVYEAKYTEKFDSARVISSAAFNRSKPDTSLLQDMDFVLIGGFVFIRGVPRMLSPSELDSLAMEFNFIRPQHVTLNIGSVSPDKLKSVLEKFKKNGDYELDGLVIGPNEPTKTQLVATEDNPKHMRAFKVDSFDDAPTTVIHDILWSVSSFGQLIPRALIDPVKFGNVTVKHAALHNVDWASERGAGVGATVKIIRSGEIIPKIVEVVIPAKFTLPPAKRFGKYHREGAKLVLDSAETDAVRAKKIGRMFSILGLDDLGGAFATKLVEAGFLTTASVARATLEDVQALPGVKSSAAKLHGQIARIRSGEFSVDKLFLASCVADSGFGESSMKKIVENCSELLSSKVDRPNVLRMTEFIGPSLASTFYSAWPKFIEWMAEVKPKVAPLPGKRKVVVGPLTGLGFSWTGYRSPEEEEFVTSQGGEIVPFGKRTSVLFYRPGGKASGKIAAAGRRAAQFKAWQKTLKG